MQTINVVKLSNGNYQVAYRDDLALNIWEFEQAQNVLSKVRECLNLLRLPKEEERV